MLKNKLEKVLGYGLLIIITCATLMINVNAGSITVAKRNGKSDKKEFEHIVVIDAGHGGYDPGKIGITGKFEKDINLEIALKLKKHLENNNIKVVMTRIEDVSMCGDEGSEVSGKKSADMRKRIEIVNSANANLCISIHQNSYESKDIKGAQVFYYSKSEEGKKFAELLQEIIKSDVDGKNKRKAKENNNYYMLRKSECTSVIVECGFLSNWEEATELADEFYQDKIAAAINKAVIEYLSNI